MALTALQRSALARRCPTCLRLAALSGTTGLCRYCPGPGQLARGGGSGVARPPLPRSAAVLPGLAASSWAIDDGWVRRIGGRR